MEFEKLKKIIAEVLNVDEEEITMETTFVDDLGADSLDIFQIIMGIEEECDIEITNGDAIITTDVGQHQMWAAQHYKFKEPRTLLTSGGLGTMGYGLGACIGAKVGRKDKTVVISGCCCNFIHIHTETAISCYINNNLITTANLSTYACTKSISHCAKST